MPEKKQHKQYVTQPGKLLFPHLFKADYKFIADGVHDARIILAPTPETIKLIDTIRAAHEDQNRAVKKENPGKRIKAAEIAYVKEIDDNGVETGNYVINPKMKAHVKTVDGREWNQQPAVFDALNRPYDPNATPWTGTIARVCFEIVPYYTAALGAGVTLRLKAVQILSLVEGNSKSAEDYGFETDESYGDKPESGGDNPGAEDDDLPF
jgi:hypothetical protein